MNNGVTMFERYMDSALYISSDETADGDFFGCYLVSSDLPEKSISYKDSWEGHSGIYIYMSRIPDAAGISRLLQKLQSMIAQNKLDGNSVAWINIIEETKNYNIQVVSFITSLQGETRVAKDYSFKILGDFFLIAGGSRVEPCIDDEGNVSGLVFVYPVPNGIDPATANKTLNIDFAGDKRGCIRADIALKLADNKSAEKPRIGFYQYISKPKTSDIFQSLYFPLISGGAEEDVSPVYTGFQMQFDPVAPKNSARNKYSYAGYVFEIVKIEGSDVGQIQDVTESELIFTSNYSSVYGKQIQLKPLVDTDCPASLVPIALPSGNEPDYYLAPDGDFMVVNGKEAGNIGGGLSGTEYFKTSETVNEKFIIRFKAGCPGCVKEFPFELASPVGPPTSFLDSPFSDEYKTSWATLYISDGQSIEYIAQPTGGALFTKKRSTADNEDKTPGILVPAELAFLFKADRESFFPLVPYAGMNLDNTDNVMSNADMKTLEAVVLSPYRRSVISESTVTDESLLRGNSAEEEQHYAATASGLLALTTQSAEGRVISWDKFVLGKSGEDEIAFLNPSRQLITAMQSSDVFLVVSNAKYLTGFDNSISIGDWGMKVNIGKEQSYGDYRNIMIFKGRKGKMFDLESMGNSLIANPKKWSQAQNFSIPKTTQGDDDASQLVILSNWLQAYFSDAYEQSSSYFDNFRNIVTDENWTGVLFLRVDIDGMPSNLSGITAGVSDPAAFNAHHLGIEVNPVELDESGNPQVDKSSVIFGLIYYLDPKFSDVPPVSTVPPDTSNDFEFKLLSLKVLIENTAVSSFESDAQLTLNSLFGSAVAKMGNAGNLYNNVLFSGSLQISNGQPVYSLQSKNDDCFYLESNIINKVDITGAVLSCQTPATETTQQSWFGMNGFIDFYELHTKSEADETVEYFDIFSFGSKAEGRADGAEDTDGARNRGLSFSNLGIAMEFPKEKPENNTLYFAAEAVRFNTASELSSSRSGSLYAQMHLGLDGLQVGAAGEDPGTLGFTEIISDIALGGVGSGQWFGLRYKLNMGTAGGLAGNSGLNATLLVYWNPESQGEEGYKAGIGIMLPGGSDEGRLLSLQNVLKLSIGQIRLTRVGKDGEKSFMLLFTDIVLKFLGMLKIPPNGNTLLYMFGNPDTQDEQGALGWYAMYRKD